MFPKRKPLLFFLLVLGIQLSVSRMAKASTELSLSDGTSSVLIMDNGPGDVDSGIGAIRFTGAIGAFSGTFGTGTTKPGTATQPQLTFTAPDITTTNLGGTLTILFGDTDFGPVQNGTVNANIGGVTFSLQPGALGISPGQILYKTFSDSTNRSLGLGNELTSQGPFGGGTFSDNFSGNTAFAQNTSLTQEIIINQSANALIGFNATLRITSALTVPEGGSAITLLAAALIAMELLRRRSCPQIS